MCRSRGKGCGFHSSSSSPRNSTANPGTLLPFPQEITRVSMSFFNKLPRFRCHFLKNERVWMPFSQAIARVSISGEGGRGYGSRSSSFSPRNSTENPGTLLLLPFFFSSSSSSGCFAWSLRFRDYQLLGLFFFCDAFLILLAEKLDNKPCYPSSSSFFFFSSSSSGYFLWLLTFRDSIGFAALQERCPPTQKSRVERLKAKEEPLLT